MQSGQSHLRNLWVTENHGRTAAWPTLECSRHHLWKRRSRNCHGGDSSIDLILARGQSLRMTQPYPPESPGASFQRGLADVAPLIIGLIPFGLVVGTVGVKVGLEPWEVSFMSAAVFAGAAQFIAMDMIGQAAGLTIILTALLVNLRHILMGASIRPYIKHMPPTLKVPFLYTMADENWAIVMRRARTHSDLTPAYIAGATLPFYTAWQISCYAGTQIGNVIGDLEQWGFDFVFTAVFLTLVLGFWRTDHRTSPIIASAIVAVIAEHFIEGSWFIVIGGLAGVIAALLSFRKEASA